MIRQPCKRAGSGSPAPGTSLHRSSQGRPGFFCICSQKSAHQDYLLRLPAVRFVSGFFFWVYFLQFLTRLPISVTGGQSVSTCSVLRYLLSRRKPEHTPGDGLDTYKKCQEVAYKMLELLTWLYICKDFLVMQHAVEYTCDNHLI